MPVIEGTAKFNTGDLGEAGEKMEALYEEVHEALAAAAEDGLPVMLTLAVLSKLIAAVFVHGKARGLIAPEGTLNPIFEGIAGNAVLVAEALKEEMEQELAAESTKH